MLTTVFLLGAGVTALLLVASFLMSPKPTTWCLNLLGGARVLVLAGTLGGVARLLTMGTSPTIEQAVLMTGLALLYGLQARSEAKRQEQDQ